MLLLSPPHTIRTAMRRRKPDGHSSHPSSKPGRQASDPRGAGRPAGKGPGKPAHGGKAAPGKSAPGKSAYGKPAHKGGYGKAGPRPADRRDSSDARRVGKEWVSKCTLRGS